MQTNLPAPKPRKLNPGMIQALSEVVSQGNYAVTACRLCEISEPTLYEWLKLALQDEEIGLTESESLYISLAKSLKRAEAEAELEMVKVIRDKAKVDREWLPAMTFLERRHPDRWGRKDRHQVDVTEKVITITHVTVVKDYGEVIEGEVVSTIEEGITLGGDNVQGQREAASLQQGEDAEAQGNTNG